MILLFSTFMEDCSCGMQAGLGAFLDDDCFVLILEQGAWGG